MADPGPRADEVAAEAAGELGQIDSAPIETLRDVYRAAGLEPTSTTVRGWKADVDRRRRSRARRHRVSRDGWGVSPDRADAMFGDYRRRFDDQIAEA